MELWLDETPQNFSERIAREFKSNRDRQCLSSFWELYLFTLWTRLSLEVEVAPQVKGSPRFADFLISSLQARAMVEATVSFDEDLDSPAARRQGEAYAALDRTNSPNFFIWITVQQGNGPMPSLALVRRELEAWLASLDPDVVTAAITEGSMRDDLPALTSTAGSWRLRFEAIPKSREARGQDGIRPLGVFDTGGARVLKTIPRVRDALIAKADQTRGADVPVLIALNAHGMFVDDDDINAVLFGDEAIQFRTLADGRVESSAIRQLSGFWTEGRTGRRSRVAAVMTVLNVGPWNVNRVEPTIWLNPWTDRPLPIDLPFRRIEIDLVQGARRETAASALIGDILHLSEDWPAPGGPWDE